MKKLFTFFCLLVALGVTAQTYNNEWIDYSRTYYKFKVARTGVCRIPQSTLANAGLGGVAAQNFQLFRNGKEVPMYVTNGSGIMGASDYIEFWGQMNDGAPDRALYRNAIYQHTTYYSLETDTAVYYLSINPAGNSFHYTNATNDVLGSPLGLEPYFMYTDGDYFKSGGINPGFAQVVGEYIYSSSYDLGEFWASPPIAPGIPFPDNKLPAVYAAGPDATVKFGMVGNADNPRTVQVSVNGTILADTTMNSFNDLVTSRPVPLGLIAGGSADISFLNNSTVSTDRMVVSFCELTYPRAFNFGGQANFAFQLPAKAAGYRINIINVPLAGPNPVLYDLTNGLRYTAYLAGATVAFAVQGSTANTNLVLVNEDPTLVQTVTTMTPRLFVNFANTANQGNYIIISNPALYTGSSGNNPVMDYKNYRSSPMGGGFDAQVYDINELVDQFAFGIKKHPISIQNFLRYARAKFAAKPQFCLLIGHGMTYDLYNNYSETMHDPLADQLNLIPTFGTPASDNKLAADDGAGATPVTPIGRLSVESGTEIEAYLSKVKEYEQAQSTSPNTIAGRLWMKNGVHLTGVSEPYLGTILCNYESYYASIIADTLAGAMVSLYCDGNASQVSQVPTSIISSLFTTGLSFLNYFGHSSNQVLGYNLDNPTDYNNQGKYPVFLINGCDAGDFFIYDAQRPAGVSKTLSETYVLAPERGAIAFVASTNFGIVNYLNIFLTGLYNLMAGSDYGKPIGILEKDGLNNLVNSVPGDFFARLHAEQMTIHGDPYLKLNQGQTDYDVESSQVTINPTLVSVSNTVFTYNARIYNLGKAVSDSVQVTVTRTYPNGTSTVLLSKKLRGIRYVDSVQLAVPVVGSRDKGDNKITITVNPGNVIPEVTYANNSLTTDVFVYQDGATPVYPYNYSIINTPTSKLVASTANPLIPSTQYVMELDTTQNFNSSMKVDKYLTSVGGELEFDPGVNFMDSVVYYWRVSPVPTTPTGVYTWSNSSFVYIDPARSSTGMNQSHYFQHEGSNGDSVSILANRQWGFGTATHYFYLSNAMFPTSGQFEQDFAVGVDGNSYIQSACVGHSLIFNVFDPVTLRAWLNVDPTTGNNLYLSGSGAANCGTQRWWNFEFSYETQGSRGLMMRFMDSIPNGYFVVVRSDDYDAGGSSYIPNWRADTTAFGSGKSMYNYLLNAGFADVDSVTYPRDWQFIYKKGDPSFVPQYKISHDIYDKITQSVNAYAPMYSGTVTSPLFGPSKKWSQMHWRGHDPVGVPATDTVGVQVIGIDSLGNFRPLYNLTRGVQDLDLSTVNARQYPYIQLKLTTLDTVHAKPFQLDYWRVNYTPVPEGALAPNLLFKAPDTVSLGQPIEIAIPFKNVSPYAFDSMRIKLYVQDRSNSIHTIVLPRRKPLNTGDTLTLDYTIDSKPFTGANTLYIGFNPDNDQPEQYLGNNFLYKSIYVRGDGRNPNLDVTFDNIHILNDDIVSARPHIQIKLQSPSQYLLLTDTSLLSVQVKYPDGSLHAFRFNTDTLRFIPATSGNNNVAMVDFTPAFTTQYNPEGDEYQLIVTGKDQTGVTAGATAYRVDFKVITKPMISNMLNYPNPFTTSTAFVFTITGSEVPQNIKIQILTITGKVVREITKEELGPLHIGRNITEFKWNGTDSYGNRLANGVYLYHVVTNLNGQSLTKYKAAGDNTDKYFNNGYGKMYLMK
ncbi:C25 family cysteine peptidase [Puia sp.]|jgi:hypothetical protein|uniref:putative type IX secretion system sortase PorU2 n=1 Tax=Puia sp. TaxID=2045100 RepID=UPI002F3E9ECF